MARNNTANTTAQKIESIAQRIMTMCKDTIDAFGYQFVRFHNLDTHKNREYSIENIEDARRVAKIIITRAQRGEHLFSVNMNVWCIKLYVCYDGDIWNTTAYGGTPGYHGVEGYGYRHHGRIYPIPEHLGGC